MKKRKPMVISESKPTSHASRWLAIASLVIFFVQDSQAQLQVRPLPHNNQLHPDSYRDSENRSGRTKELPPLTLPFFDDFSKPYINPNLKEIYPDTNRWENGYTVWVNDGLGINAPSINVASFDGLNSEGNPYNATEIFLSGFTDSLVSRKIDLSETAAFNPVSIAERNSVYLSFYYQWKGNGEAPDADDYLQVQFKNDAGKWETVATYQTQAEPKKEEFNKSIVKVDGDRFFTKRFQFRFRTFGRQSGPYDTWNIDYVYLNKNRTINDTSLGVPDQAISSTMTSIFPGNYYAIPYYHFLANPNVIAPKFTVSNLRGDPPDVLNYFVEGKFTSLFYSKTDTTASVVSLSNLHPDPTNSDGINDDGSGTINPFETRTVTVKHINAIDTVTTLDPNADGAVIELKANLITGDNINPETGEPADDWDPKYAPIDFRVNDTIQTRYELKNYYAYDDGVAEYAGGLVAPGNVFAYRFDLPENLHDTLRVLEAFDIYFPSYGLTSNQNVDFFVFKEENGKPAGDSILRISSVSIRSMGTNTFQRIRFLPARHIWQNSFFVGWRQPASGQVLVGIDNSNDTGDRMFFNAGGSINPDPARWEKNTVIKGSFMVRPVFGTGVVDPQTSIEEKTSLALFPNPNRGSFQITGHPEAISVISIAGQSIPYEHESYEDKTFIRINVPSGIYIVRYRSGGVVHAHKVIVTE